MKTSKLLTLFFVLALMATMVACGGTGKTTKIKLSDEQITVGGTVATSNKEDAVFVTESLGDTIVNITKPGTYTLSGTLSSGQIAVNLGDDAKENPEAVVTLVLKDVDITCSEAPALVVYNAYECVAEDAEKADTKNAGINIFIPNKTVNYLNGACVLDEYEAAIYSNVSMNIDGKKKGELYVNAYTDMGHGIYSEGNITINGGTLTTMGSAYTASAGLYSRKNIYINGGTVVSTGHIYDEIATGEQNFAVFSFVESQNGGNTYEVKNKKEKTILPAYCDSDFTVLVVSGKRLKEANFSLWCEDVQFMVAPGLAGGFMGDPSLLVPEGVDPEDLPDFMLTELVENTDPTIPDFGGRGEVPEFEVDEENADIVFDIVKGENLFHVFY